MKLLTKDKNNKYQLNPKLSEKKRSGINVTNKCAECDNAYTYIPIGEGNIYQACRLDDKVVNAYGCDRELDNLETTSNIDDKTEGEERSVYDYDDKDKYLDRFQRGY